jgi:hypothetical protein
MIIPNIWKNKNHVQNHQSVWGVPKQPGSFYHRTWTRRIPAAKRRRVSTPGRSLGRMPGTHARDQRGKLGQICSICSKEVMVYIHIVAIYIYIFIELYIDEFYRVSDSEKKMTTDQLVIM